MKIQKGHSVIFLLAGLIAVFLPQRVSAFCPLCMIATGAISGVFRWLGIDDAILGIWLGGFTLSTTILFNNFLIRKNKRFPLQFPLFVVISYSLMVLTLFWSRSVAPYNNIFGVNKIFVGMLFGSLLLMIAPILDKLLRRLNQGKILVSHQKVLVALILLFLCSLIFYSVIK